MNKFTGAGEKRHNGDLEYSHKKHCVSSVDQLMPHAESTKKCQNFQNKQGHL